MVYLKSLFAGIFNLIFAGVVVLYIHMATYAVRRHSGSPDAGTWDPVSFISPGWWVVLSIIIFSVSFYRELRKLTRKHIQ